MSTLAPATVSASNDPALLGVFRPSRYKARPTPPTETGMARSKSKQKVKRQRHNVRRKRRLARKKAAVKEKA